MKNAIALVLALVALGASRAEAYSHSIRNQQSRAVKVWVNYAACGNDTFFLKSGEVVTFRSGLCCITSIRFYTVDDDGKSNQGAWITGGSSMPYCENTNTYLSHRYNSPYVYIK